MNPKQFQRVFPGIQCGLPPLSRRKFFTITQLATRWGVSSTTIIRLIEEGQLTGLKIRGAYKISRDSVESYERKVAF